jgi:DNA invertase Pin-like site-specific DNA recombinase
MHLDAKHKFKSATTLAGLAKANSQGRVGGRRPVLSPEKRAQAVALIEAGQLSMREIAKRLGVSRSSLYNANLSARPTATTTTEGLGFTANRKGRP